MATAEERHKILEMVAAGKISAEEAAKMLSATPETEAGPPPQEAATAVASPPPVPEAPTAPPAPASKEKKGEAGSGPSWLRVRITDSGSGRNKVSVNIPLRLMKVGLQLGGNFAPELRDFDWDTLSTALAEGEGGLLVEVQDEEDGEHVRVFVE